MSEVNEVSGALNNTATMIQGVAQDAEATAKFITAMLSMLDDVNVKKDFARHQENGGTFSYVRVNDELAKSFENDLKKWGVMYTANRIKGSDGVCFIVKSTDADIINSIRSDILMKANILHEVKDDDFRRNFTGNPCYKINDISEQELALFRKLAENSKVSFSVERDPITEKNSVTMLKNKESEKLLLGMSVNMVGLFGIKQMEQCMHDEKNLENILNRIESGEKFGIISSLDISKCIKITDKGADIYVDGIKKESLSKDSYDYHSRLLYELNKMHSPTALSLEELNMQERLIRMDDLDSLEAKELKTELYTVIKKNNDRPLLSQAEIAERERLAALYDLTMQKIAIDDLDGITNISDVFDTTMSLDQFVAKQESALENLDEGTKTREQAKLRKINQGDYENIKFSTFNRKITETVLERVDERNDQFSRITQERETTSEKDEKEFR